MATTWRVMVHDSEWRDSGEGPWDNADDAEWFAHCEVGLPWLVVSSEGTIAGAGDASGRLRAAPRQTVLTCPNCGRQWGEHTAHRSSGIAFCTECVGNWSYLGSEGWIRVVQGDGARMRPILETNTAT
jgi:hypothetical protein